MVDFTQVTFSIGPAFALVLAATSTSRAGRHRLATLRDLVRGARPLRAALAEQVLGGATAQRGDLVGGPQYPEALHGGLDDVDRVRAARRLAQQVPDPSG